MFQNNDIIIRVEEVYYLLDGSTHTASVVAPLNGKYEGDITIAPQVHHNYETFTVTSIAERAFENCASLSSITIPDSVTSIGKCAFIGCTNISSIIIPDSVTSIGESALRDCNITSVVIGKSVTHIGESAFEGCTELISIVVSKDNITYDSCDGCNVIVEKATGTLIAGCRESIIPDGVTCIGWKAFCYGNITSIVIPDSVTSIEYSAFEGCTELSSIVIGKNVAKIDFSAFLWCTGLMSIIVDKDNATYDSCDGCNVIVEKATKTLVLCCQKSIIPNSVTSIGEWAFSNCTGIIYYYSR